MRQPQFFCGLGMPKTGTTWLADYLGKIPDVYLPLMKELQIFNRMFNPELYDWMNGHFAEILAKRVVDLPVANKKVPELISLMAEMLTLPYLEDTPAKMKAYRRLFKGRLTGQKVFGEFSTTYCLLPENGLKHLQAAFESPKFILVLRDPVNRYWSHLKHEIRRDETFDPVSYAQDDTPDSEFSRMADYAEVLPRIWKTLGKENVHLLFYESLFVEKDEEAIKGLTDFLGVEFQTPDFDKIVYAGADIDLPDNLALVLRDRFEPQYAFLKQEFSTLPEGIRD